MNRQPRGRALVALSREVHSIYALRLACQLGRLGHLSLDLVHVIEHDALPWGAGWAPHSWAREREQEARQEVGQMVQAEQEFCNVGSGLSFEHGQPVSKILRRLNSGDYDLVILGGKPSGQPGALLSHLVKESPVPVVIARAARPLRRVLMCTDGSQAAERTLGFMGRLLGDSTVETALLSLTEEGGAATSRGREILTAEGVEPRLLGGEGANWQNVLAETTRGDYDLLVVAKAPEGGGLRELLSGNPLLRLALHAPCPVLVQSRVA